METVYLETSFISYLVSKPSRDIIIAANQQLTAIWWNEHRYKFTCFTSELVLDEISMGDSTEVKKRSDIILGIFNLNISEDVDILAQKIIDSKVLPDKAARDAVHIAVACVNNINYLLTWNIRHIANAHIRRKIINIVEGSGYQIPIICTPLEMIGEENVF